MEDGYYWIKNILQSHPCEIVLVQNNLVWFFQEGNGFKLRDLPGFEFICRIEEMNR